MTVNKNRKRRDGKTLKLEGLTHDRTRHGKVRWFYRDKRGKKQLRGINSEPPIKITDEVLTAYLDAKARLDDVRPELKGRDTLGWLIETYLRNRKFANDLTRADHRSVLGRVQRDHGHRPYQSMQTKHVEILRDDVGGFPGNKRVKYMCVMFGWAVKQGYASQNPAKDAELLKISSGGHTAWTPENVAAFEECHPIGSKARLAFALFLYTGQRVSDVAQWGPLNLRNGRIVYKQHKGRTQRVVHRSLPIVAPLKEIMDASELGKSMWLHTDYDAPFTIKGLGNKMRQWCDEAGLHHLSAHGIRKAMGNIAAERGCTAHEIMEILGVTLQVAEIYTRDANKRVLSDSGFNRAFGDGK